MVTIKKGNLLEATEKVIAHQVNCLGVAGGLAADVFKKWPDAENDYLQIIERIHNGHTLLGLPQLTGQQKDGHVIANIYGQYYPGKDYRPASLKIALRALGNICRKAGWSVALPYKLSCGICGGDWDEVLAIIEEAMDGVECVIYRWERDVAINQLECGV